MGGSLSSHHQSDNNRDRQPVHIDVSKVAYSSVGRGCVALTYVKGKDLVDPTVLHW